MEKGASSPLTFSRRGLASGRTQTTGEGLGCRKNRRKGKEAWGEASLCGGEGWSRINQTRHNRARAEIDSRKKIHEGQETNKYLEGRILLQLHRFASVLFVPRAETSK